MGKFSRSWRLMKASWEILKKDKEIMLFPVISGVTLVVVLASFAVPLFWASGSASLQQIAAENDEVLNFVIGFIFYFIAYFIIIFFNSAIIACASIRMSGGDPTVSDGLKAAFARLPQIAGWALISATVGMILRMIEERFELVGRIVAGLLGMAWSITSFLVIPILVVEHKDPFSSFKGSTRLLKKTWGEQIIGNFSFGLIFLALMLPPFLLLMLVALTGSGALVIAAVLLAFFYIIALAIIQSALQGVFQAALYRFARTGKVPEEFEKDLLAGSVRVK